MRKRIYLILTSLCCLCICQGQTVEMKDTICWQPVYRFFGYDYPLPSVEDYRDRDYVRYTLEYFDKDECQHYLMDLAIRTKRDTVRQEETATICEGETYLFGGETLTETAVRTMTLAGERTDTLITLHLTVAKRYERQITDTIADGQTYTLDGREFTESGDYTLDYKSADDCDSTVTLHLTVNRVEVSRLEQEEMCPDEPFIRFAADYTGTARQVRILFDDSAHAAGWRDTTLTIAADGTFAIPVQGRAGEYTGRLELLFRGEVVGSIPFTVTILYPSTVLKQLWADVVAVLSADYNGGYDFTAFQWYENGVPLAGETASILYRPLIMGGEYSALLTESNGRRMMTCPLVAQTPTGMEDTQADVSLYPTIVSPCQSVHCLVSCPAEMTLYDPAGKLSLRLDLQTGENRFAAPVQSCIYVVNINVSNRPRTYKLVVR